jgi:hypothetical protein
MLMRRGLSMVGCLACYVKMNSLHVMGELHVRFHERTAGRYAVFGMLLSLQGFLEPLANSFGYRLGNMLH